MGKGIDLSLPIPAEERPRLLERLEAATWRDAAGCWIYTGYRKNHGGHRALSVHDHHTYVHQLSYALHHGPIPPGHAVRHRCDVPACWRPDHLILGTQLDNIADMHARGRAKKPPRITGIRHHMATLSDAQVAEIRRRWAEGGIKQRDLAAEYGVRQSTIWRLIHGVTRASA